MINIDELKKRLAKTSAEDFDYHETIRLFKRPPMLENDLLTGNHFIIGVRGAGKSTLLFCYYSLLLSRALCELSKQKKIIYFPIIVRLNAEKSIEPKEAKNMIIEGMKDGIMRTFDEIRTCNNAKGWVDKYFNTPLEYMSNLPEFKGFSELYYDKQNSKFFFEKDFFNEKAKDGYIDKLLKASTFVMKDIYEVKRAEDLDNICNDFFIKHSNYIENFVFFIDNISGFGNDFYQENGEFSDVLESFRKCGKLKFLISILESSQSEKIARHHGAFFKFNDISFDLKSYNGLLQTRKFTNQLLDKFLNIPDKYELIEIDDTIDENPEEYSGKGDALEQLIFASRGLPRPMFVILGLAITKYKDSNGLQNIEALGKSEILEAIDRYAKNQLDIPVAYVKHSQVLTNICRDKETYRFFCDFGNEILSKCVLSENNEPFLICLDECNKSGKSEYCFHYAHCISNDIPTHFNKITNKIDDNRSLMFSSWIKKSIKIKYEQDEFSYEGESENEE